MSGSHIGKAIFVSAAAPATNTAAGFAALTWTKVNGLQTAPQVGVTHANIDVPDLESGFVAGVKGAGTGNDSTATFRLIAADAGQVIVRTAANANGAGAVLSIRVARGTGAGGAPAAGNAVQYAQGYAHTYIENQPTDTTFEGFSVNFKQAAPTIDAVFP